GENRVKEAMEKFVSLKEEFPDIELHMIGALQTNKALMAAKLFDVIETIDRPELAKAVSAAIMKIGKKPRLYMEVNVGGETQKSGIEYDKAEKFLRFCLEECNLEIEGLMCIPPQGENPEPYFEKMRLLKEKLNMKHLSMGMSEDYRIAVKFGATEVRIGSAIFK
ncbi:MAG: YggS family pyridoxal phosphate-dependent enzyme, partial [Alphaproteobacteria bacterium]|nr:YggS family pyridoxal phosphate-dependent enzyme [Alphaproteobacteria bacterium]